MVGPDRRDRLATVYGPAPGGGLVAVEMEAVPFTARPQLLEGAVGLVSSVPDFLRFSQMLLEKGALGGTRLLQAATAARMTANGLPDHLLKARGGRMGWGLANVDVRMEAGDSGANVGEYGWDGTGGTIFWVDPVNRDGRRADDPGLTAPIPTASARSSKPSCSARCANRGGGGADRRHRARRRRAPRNSARWR